MSKGTDYKIKAIIMLGSPGSGKGTQSQMLAWDYFYNHIPVGELLREEVAKPCSKFKSIIEENMRSGSLVPSEITLNVITHYIESSLIKRFVIDAFPNSKDNLAVWIDKMEDNVEVIAVFLLNCREDTCVERCLQRGLQGSGRPDDHEITIKRRIRKYHEDIIPVLKYFEEIGVLNYIDANRGKEEVSEEIKRAINKMQEKL